MRRRVNLRRRSVRTVGRALRCASLLLACTLTTAPAKSPPALRPVVETEEDIYTYTNANNGAGPLWCHGSTCLVRIGDDVFASGLETLKDTKPLNNCRWVLYQRGKQGWQLRQADATGRTREPCPLVGFPDGRLFLSANPTLTPAGTYGGPARPEVLQFLAKRGGGGRRPCRRREARIPGPDARPGTA